MSADFRWCFANIFLSNDQFAGEFSLVDATRLCLLHLAGVKSVHDLYSILEGLISSGHRWLKGRGAMSCMHGDVHTHPTARINNTIGRHTANVRVGLCLPYPIILGWDWEQFWALFAPAAVSSDSLARKEKVIRDIFPFSDTEWFCYKMQTPPNKTGALCHQEPRARPGRSQIRWN